MKIARLPLSLRLKGGPGSGHHGHAGRPGKRGGSAPSKGGSFADRLKNAREIRGMALKGLEEDHAEYYDSLSTEEKDAITFYTGADYITMNTELRQGKCCSDPENTERVRVLNNALNRNEIKETMVVYRGFNDFVINNAFHQGEIQVGDTMWDAAFMSTSPVDHIAEQRSYKRHGVNFRILVPKGSKGAYLNGLSAASYEPEILFPPSSGLKIHSIDYEINDWGRRTYMLDVELVQQ